MLIINCATLQNKPCCQVFPDNHVRGLSRDIYSVSAVHAKPPVFYIGNRSQVFIPLTGWGKSSPVTWAWFGPLHVVYIKAAVSSNGINRKGRQGPFNLLFCSFKT